MSKAVQFDSYGGIDVLEVRDVPRPVPAASEVLVEVRSAGINPSEAVIFQRRFRLVRAATWREWWPNSAPRLAVLLSGTK